MTRGLLALALVLALGVHAVHAQPAPLAPCLSPTACPLGVTYLLSDGSTVTVWDGYLTADPAPDPGTAVFAVSAAVCTSAAPDRNVRRLTSRHFDLPFPRQSGSPLPGFYGWDDRTILPPLACYSGWLAFQVPQGRVPFAVSYYESRVRRAPSRSSRPGSAPASSAGFGPSRIDRGRWGTSARFPRSAGQRRERRRRAVLAAPAPPEDGTRRGLCTDGEHGDRIRPTRPQPSGRTTGQGAAPQRGGAAARVAPACSAGTWPAAAPAHTAHSSGAAAPRGGARRSPHSAAGAGGHRGERSYRSGRSAAG
jgi:hypothetical protein